MTPGEEGELSSSIGRPWEMRLAQDLTPRALGTTINKLRKKRNRLSAPTTSSLATTDASLTCRGISPWVVFSFIVLVQGCPFLASPWTQTCGIDGTEGFGFVMQTLLPYYPSSWFTGCCLAYFLYHWERSCQLSRLHFWTGVYLTVALVSNALYTSIAVFDYCNLLGNMVFIPPFVYTFSYVAPWMIWTWLSVLKLRITASLTPNAERIGSALAKVSFFIFPLEGLAWNYTVLSPREVELCAYVVSLLIVALVGCVVFAMEVSARAMTEEGAHLDIDVDTAAQLLHSSRMARISATAIAISGVSSVTCLLVTMYLYNIRVVEAIWALDAVFNAAACIALSGFCEPALDSSACIRLGVSLIEDERFRQIKQKICGTMGASTGSALVVSALMGSARPFEVLEHGMDRFRCIRWEVLQQRPDIIMGGAPLDVLGPGKDDLYSLSEPCRLGECDMFFSHSWRDGGTVKWQALCCWCDEFKMVHGRFPRLWLDKVCIQQAQIDIDLKCLPVFLAGCNSLFAAGGLTYHTRLWCVMELLIYREMLINDPKRSQPVVWAIGNESHELQLIRDGWVTVDVRNCECFLAEDKEQFMRFVRSFPGGIDRFNLFIQTLGQTVDRDYIQDYDEVLVI